MRVFQRLELRNHPPQLQIVGREHYSHLHERLCLERRIVQEVFRHVVHPVHAAVLQRSHELLPPGLLIAARVREHAHATPRHEQDRVGRLTTVHHNLPWHVNLVAQVLREKLLVVLTHILHPFAPVVDVLERVHEDLLPQRLRHVFQQQRVLNSLVSRPHQPIVHGHFPLSGVGHTPVLTKLQHRGHLSQVRRLQVLVVGQDAVHVSQDDRIDENADQNGHEHKDVLVDCDGREDGPNTRERHQSPANAARVGLVQVVRIHARDEKVRRPVVEAADHDEGAGEQVSRHQEVEEQDHQALLVARVELVWGELFQDAPDFAQAEHLEDPHRPPRIRLIDELNEPRRKGGKRVKVEVVRLEVVVQNLVGLLEKLVVQHDGRPQHDVDVSHEAGVADAVDDNERKISGFQVKGDLNGVQDDAVDRCEHDEAHPVLLSFGVRPDDLQVPDGQLRPYGGELTADLGPSGLALLLGTLNLSDGFVRALIRKSPKLFGEHLLEERLGRLPELGAGGGVGARPHGKDLVVLSRDT
mmetsp:Transcript_9871/g.24620  ORF Transcript_9871/g.24620 Transcript_9871/m.24620 type:complete len:526 (+) Transcript_9871:415-1992(+)